MVAKFFMCEREVSNFILFFFFVFLYFYFTFIYFNIFVIFINYQDIKHLLLFVSGKKAILSYERGACFDSD